MSATTAVRPWRGVLAEFADRLPIDPGPEPLTLGEGGTPLVRSGWLSGLSACDVWLKLESANPTGSFKDRGMVVAMADARARGAQAAVCASTGNTSASMAAYAVRAGMRALVLVPEGRIAAGKLAQAVMHGAQVVQVRSGFDGCLRLARALADAYPVALVNSVNPMRIEGQKTAAFEVVAQLGRAPDLHVLPVGNAGNITAYWKGYREAVDAGLATGRPAMWGFQAAGAAPIVLDRVVDQPDTLATAIRIGNPASWGLAVAARDESGGRIDAVSDDQIMAAQQQLAARDGVFVEPASAAGAAGLVIASAAGEVAPGQTVAVTLTGHGLKDIATALAHRAESPARVIDDGPDAVTVVAAALGLA